MRKIIGGAFLLMSFYIIYNVIFINNNALKMVNIPSGTFTMGQNDIATPTHQVTLSSFSMSKYEITNAQYAEILQWAYDNNKLTVSTTTILNNEGSPQELLYLKSPYCQISYAYGLFRVDTDKERFPVREVSWYGSQAYCAYLSLKEGENSSLNFTDWSINHNITNSYRLPTEAQWEYACRGGATTKWHFGNVDTSFDYYAWHFNNSQEDTHEVGTKLPNNYGLYDVHGNVWEWCGDWRGGFYTADVAIDPTGASSDAYRVLRGGSNSNDANMSCCAYRGSAAPNCIHPDVGFRVCFQ